jgi:hypothetical protein
MRLCALCEVGFDMNLGKISASSEFTLTRIDLIAVPMRYRR